MLNRLFVVCFFFLSFTAASTASIPVTDTPPIAITPRVALVVGNTRYHRNPLRTSSADANAVAGLLRDRGFEVIQIENASLEMLEQALLEFNARLGESGTGLFYFAGHGLQTAKSVLLLPVDTDSTSLDTMQRTALGIDRIIRQMSLGRPGQPNLLIIDSCLNNPYHLPAQTRPEVGHLPELPAETLIAFATAPGAVAYEGVEQQGIYAQALMNALGKPGLDAGTIFDDVQHTVRVRTRNQQVPWVLSSLDSPLMLSPDSVQAREEFATSHPGLLSLAQLKAMPTRGILPKDGDAQYELEFWQSIKDSTDAADYEAYLEAYPDGKFAPLAKSRAQRYKKSTPEPARQPAYVVNELDDQYEVIRNANIRQTPSSKSRRLAELQRGSSVHVTGQLADKQWYQVRFAGMTGYIYAELLRKPVAKPAPKAKPAPEPKPKPIARPTPQPVKVLPVRPGKVEEIQDCPSCPVMLALPAGNFTMGASRGDRSEKPAHKVSINKPFAIGKYEVTVAQWNECHTAGACSYKPDFNDPQDNSPIRDISWSDAQEYTKWLSTVTQKPYRLPTEAEWEYAARGGTDTTYWWGNEVGASQADCKNCGGKWNNKSPAAVDAFPANPFGLHGTSGGVWEWVADCWHKTYKGAPKDGTAWSRNDCRENVIRGGAWRNDANYIHSASRFKYDTHVRYLLNGFRIARTLP
ncbi:SUMF1/EgtB/PvdO family nonheme iron enzyme [Pseudomonadota bacterium]